MRREAQALAGIALVLLGFSTGCGRYGPPTRTAPQTERERAQAVAPAEADEDCDDDEAASP